MPKQKSHKGLSKRIKITASGKLKRKRSYGSHLMSGKNAKRRRRIGTSTLLTGASGKIIRTKLKK